MPDSPARRRLACMPCREIKIRCLPISETDTTSVCQRCKQNQIQCVYTKRKYGSKLREGDPDETSSIPSIIDNWPQQPVLRDSIAHPPFHVLPAHPINTTMSHDDARRVVQSDGSSVHPPPMYGASPDTHESSTPHHRASRTVEADVSKYLDPDIEAETYAQGVHADDVETGEVDEPEADSRDDPVALQYLSSLEADDLFKSFHQRLNPIIAILDPTFHTFERVKRSPILLTSILAVSAKFFRPPLYRHLLSHAQMLLNRGIGFGVCDIGIVKALLILVFWKDPTDKSAWVKIGMAIRLGYQLGLHSGGWSGEEDQGVTCEMRDRRRTWFCLSCADKAYSELFGLPIAIPMEHCANIGIPPSAHLPSIDIHLACSMALTAPHLLWLKIKQTETDTASRRVVLDDVFLRFHQHLQIWFPDNETGMSRGMSLSERSFLKWIDLIELMRLKFEMLECCQPVSQPDILQECLMWGIKIADQTDKVADCGILLYLQDTSATRLSTYGTMLYKLFWKLNLTQQKTVVDLIKRVYRRCSSTSNGDKTAATAFVARFLHRCLRSLSFESRVNSRRPSPAVAPSSGQAAANDNGAMDVYFDIRNFLQDEQLPSSHIQDLDSQYWATLFANPPLDNDTLSWSNPPW